MGKTEDVVSNLYKTCLSTYIKENEKGFYSLTNSYMEIQENFMPKISYALEEYGFHVNSFVIKAIAIPKDIQYKIEDQAFEIRHRLEDAVADEKLSKKSLEEYEAKLAIQHKYPNATPSLTEHEKDLALRRYMLRTGKNKEDQIDHNINIVQKQEKTDEEINEKNDIIPEIAPNKFRAKFFKSLLLALIFSAIMFAVDTILGAVLTYGTIVVFFVIAIINVKNFKTRHVEFPENDSLGKQDKESDNDIVK